MRELQNRFSETAALPFRELGTLPTPVQEAGALAEAASAESVWIKRDDLSGVPYGGNKVRKLEFLLGDAIARGASRVWTLGAIGSHHCLATTLYARACGLDVQITHTPQPPTEHVLKNCLAVGALGAEMSLSPYWLLPLALARHRFFDDTYFIPTGGSSAAGALGYVNAALEIDAQVRSGELPEFDTVYVAVGTAGTLAGLVVGFRLAQRPVRIVGARVVDRVIVNRVRIDALIRRTARPISKTGVSLRTWVKRGDYELVHDQFGAGYGRGTEASERAVRAARELAALELENTYTGKAMAALLAGAAGQRALYIDTVSSRPVADLIPDGFGYEQLPDAYHAFWHEASP